MKIFRFSRFLGGRLAGPVWEPMYTINYVILLLCARACVAHSGVCGTQHPEMNQMLRTVCNL